MKSITVQIAELAKAGTTLANKADAIALSIVSDPSRLAGQAPALLNALESIERALSSKASGRAISRAVADFFQDFLPNPLGRVQAKEGDDPKAYRPWALTIGKARKEFVRPDLADVTPTAYSKDRKPRAAQVRTDWKAKYEESQQALESARQTATTLMRTVDELREALAKAHEAQEPTRKAA